MILMNKQFALASKSEEKTIKGNNLRSTILNIELNKILTNMRELILKTSLVINMGHLFLNSKIKLIKFM